MKKKTTSNPLKTFNDNKAKAYMKAGGAMKAFKKSLPTAQFGNNVNYYDQNKENAKRVQMMDSISYPKQYTADRSGRMQFAVPEPKIKPVNNSGPGSGMGSMYMNDISNEIPMNKKGGIVKKKKK